MGTLTANQERLPGYCDHKLPTSCRLTSIPACCACADERAHAASYSTYIDGIGFVPWGTRWQRYCWYCREFWEKRVQVSGLRSGQTRIPEVPDQSEFLNRWYEFHRGYRIVQKEDGTEERIAVLGEPFRDVDPGCLPRTIEEMRAGRAASEAAARQEEHHGEQEQTDAVQSLEDTLDQMFLAAEAEGTPASGSRSTTQMPTAVRTDTGRESTAPSHIAELPGSNIHAQSMVPTGSRNREYQARRIAALRRELHRMRNGIERVISRLRDLGEQVPDHSEATDRLSDLGRTLDVIDGTPSQEQAALAISSVNILTRTAGGASQIDRAMASIQSRVDEARQHLDEARRNRDQAASELDAAEQELRTSQQRVQHLQREQRTTENYIRLFGTREEMLAQGDQYESPIGSMFTRAYERFRAAEEVRREERTLRRVLEDELREGGEADAQRLAELAARERDVWGVPREPAQQAEDDQVVQQQEPRGELEEYYALLRRQNWSQQAPNAAVMSANDPASPVSPIDHADVHDNVNATDGNISSTTDSNGNFPRSMLNAIEAMRERERTRGEAEAIELAVPATPASPANGHDFVEEDYLRDAEHLLTYLLENESVLADQRVPMGNPQRVGLILDRVRRGEISPGDRFAIGILMGSHPAEAVWSSGMVAARLGRRRLRGETPTFVDGPGRDRVRTEHDNTEIMAEAFQMSASLRSRAPGLTAPQQLRMLYGLQAGRRIMADVEVLQQMLYNPSTLALARSVHAAGQRPGSLDEGRQQLEEERREAARQGDHSRQELDAQRRATQAFAVAAGRTAMQTGATGLLEQMASRDQETAAAYERLRANGWAPEGDTVRERLLRQTMYRPLSLEDYAPGSESESEDEERDAQGLDATDSGRPEPKADEDMTINMGCRICYTQLAEIACLPCGHLVMCKWCSDQHSPVMAHDRTRPRRAAGCPVCRKGIRQKVRVFRA